MLKHQNLRERRTPANGQQQPGEHEFGFSAKRPIFGGIAGVPQLTHDPTIRASEVLSCTFSIQMVGKIQTKFTTLAQQISYYAPQDEPSALQPKFAVQQWFYQEISMYSAPIFMGMTTAIINKFPPKLGKR